MGHVENKAYLKHQKEIVRNQWLSYDAAFCCLASGGFGGKSEFNKPKMIHLKHNLMKNYYHASGDNARKSDILTSEIAKLIVNNPRKMTGLINTHLGKNIIGIPSRGKLVKLTAQGIQDNKAFASAIAKEIVANKGSVSFSQDGSKNKVDIGGLLQSGSALVNSLGGIFGGKKKAAAAAAQAKAEADKARAEADRARAEAEKALTEKTSALSGGGGKNMNMYLGITIVALAGIRLFFYFTKK